MEVAQSRGKWKNAVKDEKSLPLLVVD